TFSSALLRLAGRWGFWPQPMAAEVARPESDAPPRQSLLARRTQIGPPGFLRRLVARHVLPNVWEKLGPALLQHPGAIWCASALALTPFVVKIGRASCRGRGG